MSKPNPGRGSGTAGAGALMKSASELYVPCINLDSSSKAQLKGVTLLYYAPEMKELAYEIANAPSARGRVVLGKIEWSRFPDSFPNLFIHHSNLIKWAHVAFLASFHAPEVMFEQISLIYSIPRYFAKSFTILLPYFPTGTMERIEQTGEVATAHTLAKLLSVTPQCAKGPAQVVVFDIHTLQNQFYFTDNVHVRLESAVDLLIERLIHHIDSEVMSIAFPDEGAFKRFSSRFPQFKTIICHKVREGNKRIIKLKEGDVPGRHVIIVDDLVQSGSTLLETAKILKEAGALRVSCYVTHAIFPNESWKKFVDNDMFSHFWTTNSHPNTRHLFQKKPFEILSLAPSLAGVICE